MKLVPECVRHPESWPSMAAHFAVAFRLFGDTGADLVRSWFAQQIDRVTDSQFAGRFSGHFGLPGIRPSDFNHRFIEQESMRLLGGIRFLGGNTAKPFVDIVASSIADDAGQINDWHMLQQIVAERWRAFRPQALRVLLPEEHELPVDAIPDLIVHAASYGSIRGNPEQYQRRVRLEPFGELAEAEEIVRARYGQLAVETPELARNITPASREELKESFDRGSLFAIRERLETVGLLATIDASVEWLNGDVILEEVVKAEHAGRGLAAEAQRALAQVMVECPSRLLLGTIHPENTPSRKTALRVGRSSVLRYVFVTLPT